MNKLCVVVLLLSVVMCDVVAQCPRQCRCSADTLAAECDDGGLTDVPQGKFADGLQQLTITNNTITILKSKSFLERNLNDLRHLNLSHNRISIIEVEAFHGLRHLQILDLSGNSLNDLSSDLFSQLADLRSLYLGDNPGIILPISGFDLPNLTTLDLANCAIQTFANNFFSEMLQIESINLFGNQIKVVNVESIAKLTHLVHLNLKSNKLEILQRELLDLPARVRLELSANPWSCNCSLQDKMAVYNAQQYKDGIVCQLSGESMFKHCDLTEARSDAHFTKMAYFLYLASFCAWFC